jgi:hypothetical protein
MGSTGGARRPIARAARLLGCGVLLAITTTALTTVVSPSRAGAAATPVEAQMASEIISQINAERAARGLSTLHYDPYLASLAQHYAEGQAAGIYPPGDGHYVYAQTSSYLWFGFGSAAAGDTSVSSTYTIGLMDSQPHRDDLLQEVPGQGIGVGIACGANGQSWMQYTLGSTTSVDPSYTSGTPASPVVTPPFSGTSCDPPPPSSGSPTEGIAATPSGNGYWTVDARGDVTAHGGAISYGGLGGITLNAPISHIVATPDGRGYWLVAADGGAFALGDAGFYGSMVGTQLYRPVVALEPTPSGHGYWQVASDGGVFAFGDAQFLGSMGGSRLNKPVVGMAHTPSGHGYWLVASDGGVFAFGDASFQGSTGSMRLNSPIVSMAPAADGSGYWFVASDGGIFAFGAPFLGSMSDQKLNAPIVGMAVDSATGGYWLAASDGGIFSFGAPFLGPG